MITKTDAEIIDLYLQRSESAIWETEQKYGLYLYKIAFNILHDEQDCEECLNDAYLGIWNAIPPNNPTAMLPFLSKIVRRVCIILEKKPGETDPFGIHGFPFGAGRLSRK